MTHDPDARILSGPALAHVRSALMAARDFGYENTALMGDEMQAALDSLNSGKPVEDGISQRQAREVMSPGFVQAVQTQDGRIYGAHDWSKTSLRSVADEYADGDIEPPKSVEDAIMPEIRGRPTSETAAWIQRNGMGRRYDAAESGRVQRDAVSHKINPEESK